MAPPDALQDLEAARQKFDTAIQAVSEKDTDDTIESSSGDNDLADIDLANTGDQALAYFTAARAALEAAGITDTAQLNAIIPADFKPQEWLDALTGAVAKGTESAAEKYLQGEANKLYEKYKTEILVAEVTKSDGTNPDPLRYFSVSGQHLDIDGTLKIEAGNKDALKKALKDTGIDKNMVEKLANALLINTHYTNKFLIFDGSVYDTEKDARIAEINVLGDTAEIDELRALLNNTDARLTGAGVTFPLEINAANEPTLQTAIKGAGIENEAAIALATEYMTNNEDEFLTSKGELFKDDKEDDAKSAEAKINAAEAKAKAAQEAAELKEKRAEQILILKDINKPSAERRDALRELMNLGKMAVLSAAPTNAEWVSIGIIDAPQQKVVKDFITTVGETTSFSPHSFVVERGKLFVKGEGEGEVAIPFETPEEKLEREYKDFNEGDKKLSEQLDTAVKESPILQFFAGLFGIDPKGLLKSKGMLGMLVRAFMGDKLDHVKWPKLSEDSIVHLEGQYRLGEKINTQDLAFLGDPPNAALEALYDTMKDDEKELFDGFSERFNGSLVTKINPNKNTATIRAPDQGSVTAMLLFFQRNSFASEAAEGGKDLTGEWSKKLKEATTFGDFDITGLFGGDGSITPNKYPEAQSDWPMLVQANYQGNNLVTIQWKSKGEIEEALKKSKGSGEYTKLLQEVAGGSVALSLQALKKAKSADSGLSPAEKGRLEKLVTTKIQAELGSGITVSDVSETGFRFAKGTATKTITREGAVWKMDATSYGSWGGLKAVIDTLP